MSAKSILDAIAARRILILDGAMGSLIQAYKFSEEDFRGERFKDHPQQLAGCNDLLCLTKPDAIRAIHEAYMEAGADIIETCSFNSTAVSLVDYGIGGLAYEISAASAAIARVAADKFSTVDKPRFVAGSMGPTAKSASLSAGMADSAAHGISWDELEAAYYDNARGLLDGGADILIIETVFDTLNAKAALFAVSRLLEERRAAGGDDDVPVIVSATVSDNAGRLLSGQNLAAFCASLLYARPWALGLNCSFGADTLLPHLQNLAAAAPCLISSHPNAGLPNEFGAYDETPEKMAASIEKYFQSGLVNIIGGCCGTTPQHIAAIAAKAANYAPRRVSGKSAPRSTLAGTDLLDIGAAQELTLIGERTNVAGCREFLRYINEKNYPKAMTLARNMIANGAAIINVGMDDALLNAEKEMRDFLNAALSAPDIARVPFMIDSSRWNVIEAGLKCMQGKALVNSISLKDGEGEFLSRLERIRRYGAATVVMLIDEKGQAMSYERKIEIAGRAYGLLNKIPGGFPPSDIVFDPNVLAVATGIAEHNAYALDFIRACSWIRENCPGVQITGGISNLSFSFRGNNTVREAMHSVFLKHAAAAGLSMVIVNPAALISYNDIDPQLRAAVEDVILNRSADASEHLLEIARKISSDKTSSGSAGKRADFPAENWRTLNVAERIQYAVVNGFDDYIEADVLELREQDRYATPIAIVEGPLMDGIAEVGRLFGEARMYLPQVIRSAMVMKKAVAALEPFITEEKSGTGAGLPGSASSSSKIVLATVKGDVHDIGKNIVGIVLNCNGHKIIDLGVMAPAERIIEAAIQERAALVGLSALISPSLDEMIHVAGEMEKRGLRIPLLIGGAAANEAHTALRIAPAYSGPVVYVPDAARSVTTVRSLLSADERPAFLESIGEKYREIATHHAAGAARRTIISLEAARANAIPPLSCAPPAPPFSGLMDLNDYPIEKVIRHIDWQSFLHTWELAENSPPRFFELKNEMEDTRYKLIKDAKAMLERIESEGLLRLRGTVGFFPAAAQGDDVLLFDNAPNRAEIARFCFLRNQEKKQAGAYNPCLADFFALPHAGGSMGLFALSAGFGLHEAVQVFRKQKDDYSEILLAALANTLAEAFAEELHSRLRPEQFAGIRPVFGYPISPDHEDKRLAFKLLDAEKRCGLELTETAMMIPSASVCGMFIFHPAAYYFGIGPIADDQLADWAARKGISPDEARRRAGATDQ